MITAQTAAWIDQSVSKSCKFGLSSESGQINDFKKGTAFLLDS